MNCLHSRSAYVSLHHNPVDQRRASRTGGELDHNLAAAVGGCAEIFFDRFICHTLIGNDIEVAEYCGPVDDDVKGSLAGCSKYDLGKVQLDLMSATGGK